MGFKKRSVGHLNQDILENRFSVIRQQDGA